MNQLENKLQKVAKDYGHVQNPTYSYKQNATVIDNN
jgi:hypothetical protein